MTTQTFAPKFCSLPQAFTALGVSRSTAYRLIEAGRLKSVKLGRRLLISIESLNALAAELEGSA